MQFVMVQPLSFLVMVWKYALGTHLKIKQMLLLVGWKVLVLSVLVKNLITPEQILLQLLAVSKQEHRDEGTTPEHIFSVNGVWSS